MEISTALREKLDRLREIAENNAFCEVGPLGRALLDGHEALKDAVQGECYPLLMALMRVRLFSVNNERVCHLGLNGWGGIEFSCNDDSDSGDERGPDCDCDVLPAPKLN